MAEISKITVPNGTTYDIKDATARENAVSLYDMANHSICPYYSTSATYAVGDKVRYGYYIYECITAITKAEAWNAAHWEVAPTLQEQITSMTGNDIIGMTVTALKSAQSQYVVGLTVDQLLAK